MDLVSCLSYYKVKLQIYSYSYNDEGFKSLESSHGQVPLSITADGVRPVFLAARFVLWADK